MKHLSVSQLQPMAGYVLVEPAKAETKTASGIILPESEGEKPQYGVVLAVGAPECNCDDCGCGSCGCGSCGCGDEHDHDHEHKKSEACNCDDCECDCGCGEAPVSVGDQVIYKKWGGNEVTIDDVEYQFLKFEDILAIISKK